MEAIAYLRVSSAGQVDGDGFARQRAAIDKRAATMGLEIVEEFRDEGVSGTKDWHERPGLTALMERIAENGVRLVLVEKADRLTRDLVIGELILRELQRSGVQVIEAEAGQDLTTIDNPTAKLIRQVLGAVAEFEKDALVAKLRAARRRKGVKEGRKPYGSQPHERLILGLARQERDQGKTLRDVAIMLNLGGHLNSAGRQWTVSSVSRLLQRPAAPR